VNELGQRDRPAGDPDAPVLARLSTLDRLLPAWIVAAGLLLMTYPVLALRSATAAWTA
jgi:hypothetical protein